MSRIEMNTVADRAGVSSRLPTVEREPTAPAPVSVRSSRWRGPNVRGQWLCAGRYGCGRWLPAEAFGFDARWQTRASYCRTCDTARSKRYRRDVLWRDPERLARERVRNTRSYHRHRKQETALETKWRIARMRDLVAGFLAQGWTLRSLGQHLGADWRTVRRWRDGTSHHIKVATYRRVSQRARQTLAAEGGDADHHRA